MKKSFNPLHAVSFVETQRYHEAKRAKEENESMKVQDGAKDEDNDSVAAVTGEVHKHRIVGESLNSLRELVEKQKIEAAKRSGSR